MSKLDWVKWEAGKFLGGIVGMSIEEIGVYSVILNLIYDNDGPINADRERIARRCGMRPTSFAKVLMRLIEHGKITMDNGLISNEKADEVLKTRSKVVENWKKNLSGANSVPDKKTKKNKGIILPSAPPPDDLKGGVESESVEKERKKDSTSARKRSQTVNDPVAYTEAFEQLWKIYPRTRGTSKKSGFDRWRMLNDENQARVAAAIPVYAAQMRQEGREESKICHLEFFISRRIYETLAVTPASTNVVQVEWFKSATREQWDKVLTTWSSTNDWRAAWGPEPGKPGCCVPDDMVAAHNIKHRAFMFSPDQITQFQAVVDAHQKTG